MLSCLNLGYYTRGYKFNTFLNKWSKKFVFLLGGWIQPDVKILYAQHGYKHWFICTCRVLGKSLKLFWMKLALWRVSINPPSKHYWENTNTRWLSWFKNGMLTDETIMKTKNVKRRTSIPEPTSPCLCVCVFCLLRACTNDVFYFLFSFVFDLNCFLFVLII